MMGELNVLEPDFAHNLAPLAGFRNILIHEYLLIDWDHVYQNLQQLEKLAAFAEVVRGWLIRQHKV